MLCTKLVGGWGESFQVLQNSLVGIQCARKVSIAKVSQLMEQKTMLIIYIGGKCLHRVWGRISV